MEELLISPALPHPQPCRPCLQTGEPQNAHQGHSYGSTLLCISPAFKKYFKNPEEIYFKPVLHTHICPKPGVATELLPFSIKKFWSDSDLHILFRKAWKFLFSEFPWLKYEIVLTLSGTFFFFPERNCSRKLIFLNYCLKAPCCIWSNGWLHSWNTFLESYYSGELLLNSKKKTKLRHHMEASSAYNVSHTKHFGFTSRDGG